MKGFCITSYLGLVRPGKILYYELCIAVFFVAVSAVLGENVSVDWADWS